ncbi:MAG TPA: FecR domain-containing protein [Chitinophaga sp.]|uniref:FecR family protein n=1 Tax=Chitinophaga sp. TaxID=1869181 RepID=UPI002C130DD9|nr:FecR domain-containing protein [Chitinophaga sp.]HVI45125.1 FecR domain-containing protein [Chitinophaga sp.]
MNNHKRNEFRQLLRKYRDEKLTEEEITLLYDYIRQDQFADVMDEWLDETFNNPAYAGAAVDYDPELVFAGMREHMNTPKRALRWWKAAAAAAAILVFALLGYISYRPSPVAEKEVVFDVPPGRQGATLTLSGGRKILLDSASDGLLANQGTASLRKTGYQLNYQSDNKLPVDTPVFNTVSTPRGRQFKLVLADGTQVWLNAGSEIRFPTAFSGKERKIELTGEAYFEVAGNAAVPFVVQLRDSRVVVLGTHFNITDYDDEKNTNTTLLKGAVKIQTKDNEVLVKPGLQVTIDKNTGAFSSKAVDTEQVIAWTKDKLVLGNTDFAVMMRSISRWYDIDLVYAGKVPELRVGGCLHRNVNLSVVLGFLEENGVHYTMSGKTVTILP